MHKLAPKQLIALNFTVAFLLRIIFLFYGLYHDSYVESLENKAQNLTLDHKPIPKYTDIDYEVFSDGARHMYEVIYTTLNKGIFYFFQFFK
jgi:hypothetical protein